MKPNYKKTIVACFVGYVVQAIVNNFAPLLFVTFQKTYDIPLTKITLLITLNFLVQLLVDFSSAKFVDKIGYRASLIGAHVFAAIGLVLLPILPEVFQDPFIGIAISVVIYAVGGGLLEVLVSPVVEACPTEDKNSAMSLLHSFYCWGHVGVVGLSTAFFLIFGVENWKILSFIWALVPTLNLIAFTTVPIYPLVSEGETGLSLKQLLSKKTFWIFIVMMLCTGASEQAVSQWASAFAEKGLGVNKTVGDLLGPMAFAVLMGTSRLIYGKFGDRLNLDGFMTVSCVLCVISYLLISLVPSSIVNLLGCALCGFSVGIFWPGTFSKAAKELKGGGTATFAMLALAGDLGCAGGPTLAGTFSGIFNDNLKIGIFFAAIFPLVLLLCLSFFGKTKKDVPLKNDD